MNFTTQVVIDLPHHRVIELVSDPGNLPQWQTGIKSVELMARAKGHGGCKEYTPWCLTFGDSGSIWSKPL